MDFPVRLRLVYPLPTAVSPREDQLSPWASPDLPAIEETLQCLTVDSSGFVEGLALHSYCERLLQLCAGNAVNCKLVVERGGVPMLLNSMYCYSLHMALVRDVFSVMLCLAQSDDGPGCRNAVADLAIPYLVDALYNHFGNPEVLQVLCELIVTLASGEEVSRMDLMSHGARVLLRFIAERLPAIDPG
eukprot:RCo007906